METPILLGANPETSNPVEWIPIRFDRWTVRVEGLVDSELTLHSTCIGKVNVILTASLNGKVYGPCLVRAEFVKRGTERTITVFAVECK